MRLAGLEATVEVMTLLSMRLLSRTRMVPASQDGAGRSPSMGGRVMGMGRGLVMEERVMGGRRQAEALLVGTCRMAAVPETREEEAEAMLTRGLADGGMETTGCSEQARGAKPRSLGLQKMIRQAEEALGQRVEASETRRT